MPSGPETRFRHALRRATAAIDALHNAYLGLDHDAQRGCHAVPVLQRAMAEARAQAQQTSRAVRFAGLRAQGLTIDEIAAADTESVELGTAR